jgi:hypothetical protein
LLVSILEPKLEEKGGDNQYSTQNHSATANLNNSEAENEEQKWKDELKIAR